MWEVKYHSLATDAYVVFGIYFDQWEAERVAKYMNRTDSHNYRVYEIEEEKINVGFVADRS